MNVTLSNFAELPAALWSLTGNTFTQACKGKSVIDIRFSKLRQPAYNDAHKKTYVIGYSGWLKIDPIAKTVLVTVINSNEPVLHRSVQTSEQYAVAANIVKASSDYLYTFDEAGRVTFRGKASTVVKRSYEQTEIEIDDQRESLQMHQTVDEAFPGFFSRAPIEHPVMRRPKGLRYETVQKLYPTDFEKVLSNEVPKRVVLTLTERLKVCADVADSLACMHHDGYMHNDPRPENILLEFTAGGWRGRLTDFGNAKKLYTDLFKGAQYEYWDSLARLGIFQPFTDIYGLSMTLGNVLWGEAFESLAKRMLNRPAEHFLREIKSLLQTDVHLAAFALLKRVITENEGLLQIYKGLPQEMAYQTKLERLEDHHINAVAFAKEIRNLAVNGL